MFYIVSTFQKTAKRLKACGKIKRNYLFHMNKESYADNIHLINLHLQVQPPLDQYSRMVNIYLYVWMLRLAFT